MTGTEKRVDVQPYCAPASAEILVGVDDSEGGQAAVDWATREAAVQHVPLRLVRLYSWGRQQPWVVADEPLVTEELKQSAEQMIERASRRAFGTAPHVEIAGEVNYGDPVDYLVRHGERSGLVVVGSHRLGALGRVVLGSVSAAVAARASCPVVVVSGMPDADWQGPGRVVVGVDPQHDVSRVLAFAFNYASRHDQPLHAFMSWQADTFADARWPYELQRTNDAKRWLAESLAGWQEHYPDVVVRPLVEHGNAVATLVRQADPLDLLVVGRHGSRARWGRLLGSTSQGVLHHARCPVAVVSTEQTPVRSS